MINVFGYLIGLAALAAILYLTFRSKGGSAPTSSASPPAASPPVKNPPPGNGPIP